VRKLQAVLGIRSRCQDRIFNLVECLAYRLLGRVLRDPENFVKGPSIGFDIGGNAAKCFTLVYNLKETRQLFQRFPGVEGSLYFVGGFSLNYNRTDDVTLAPDRRSRRSGDRKDNESTSSDQRTAPGSWEDPARRMGTRPLCSAGRRRP
jgi:hypothetical protein